MTDAVYHHCTRPWWKRPPVWLVGSLALLLIVLSLTAAAGRPPAIAYGAFLDQLDAGNVGSVVFRGTEIEGHLKQPLAIVGSDGPVPTDVFRSRIPDFGDPVLLADLRRQHVAIDVTWSSPWASWMGGGALAVIVGAIIFAKPGLLVFGGLLVAGLWRAMRGKTAAEQPAMPSTPMAMHPMQRTMKLMSGLGSQQAPAATGPEPRASCCSEPDQGSLAPPPVGLSSPHR